MDFVTLASVGLPIAGVLGTGAWWVIKTAYGAFKGAADKLSDHDKRLGGLDEDVAQMRETQEQLHQRLEKTEEAARSVDRLADAVRHMGEMFSGQLGSLADKMKIHNDNNNQRFDELNDRLERRTFRRTDE